MTDEAARRQLKKIMKSFTGGSVLHLLGEVYEEMAEQTRRDGDETRTDQCRTVATTLFVLGLGIDAACQR